MSLPTVVPSRPDAALVPGAPVRPPLRRPAEGRRIAGVAAGLAAHLDRPVRLVRVILFFLALLNGAGVLLYLWLWALVPTSAVATTTESHTRLVPSPATGSAPTYPSQPPRLPAPTVPFAPPEPAARARVQPETHRSGRRWRLGLLELLGGVLLLGVAAFVLVSGDGIAPWAELWPALPLIGGIALIYVQLDRVEVSRWRARRRAIAGLVVRVLLGLALVVVALSAVAAKVLDLSRPLNLLVALAAIIGGSILVLAPWMVRLVLDLGAEQEARAGEQVRADMAAHLHDSVLQTLALIQRANTDPTQVVRLARRQERDLRAYLYGGGAAQAGTIAAAVRELVDEVEDLHAVNVELILVGDAPVGPHAQALLAAMREASVNAARHAGGTVSVYVEVGSDQVEAFVRDRGDGFVLADVPADRLGVRRSIIERMRRHGGAAEIRSVVGEGTEVRLSAPLDDAADLPNDPVEAKDTDAQRVPAPAGEGTVT